MRGNGRSTGTAGTGEAARLLALASYEVVDTPPEAHFEALARLAARLCDTPMAIVTLVDEHRQWFKAQVGLDVRETPRNIAFCAHTIEGAGLFQVPDARLDRRFADNPLVTGSPHLRFYAGVPLEVEGGHRLGSLAVLDRAARCLTAQQEEDLFSLARQVVLVLEEHRYRLVAEATSAQAKRQSDSLLAIAGRVAQLGAWELDIERQKVTWSDVVADIHGMPRATEPPLDRALSFYVEPDRSMLTQAVDRCLRDGTSFDLELVLQPANGALPRWVRSIGEAVKDGTGRITHLRGACQDITERKSHLLQIQRLADRLAATLESIPDPFLTVGADGRVQRVNAAVERMFARPRGEILGRSLPEVLPGEAMRGAFREPCIEVLRTQRPIEFEVTEAAPARHYEVRVFPVEDGLAIHARDISERKDAEAHRDALEQQLRQAQKLESIGTLAGGIAHDFNNILGAILGNVALVEDAVSADPAARHALATIATSAQRARSLVQQILAFGRQQATQRQPQALRPLVERAVELLQSTLPDHVTLATRFGHAEVWSEVDGNLLQQVLINLCTNAWHALPAGGGRITVGLDDDAPDPRHQEPQATKGPHAHLWVQDDGCGMDADQQARIFEPFFTTKPVGQGTGLGLSAAHGIVVAHGGTIHVESRPGAGSLFSIYLPACAAGTPAAPAAAEVAPPPMPLEGLRVLCVDDDPVMLTTMQALLERDGCRAVAFTDPRMALDRLLHAPSSADLLVTDHNMPVMDGLVLAREVHRVCPQLPIIMASGFLSDELCAQAAQFGVRATVQKERTVEDLMKAVREVVARAQPPTQ